MDSPSLPDPTACQFRQLHHHHHIHHPAAARHHHHHHYHVLPHCPLHGYMLHFSSYHASTCPAVSAPSHPQSQNNPPPTTSIFQVATSKLSEFTPRGMIHNKEDEELEMEEQQQLYEEGDDEEDPVFVLTDEWREFFAQSEAKRRLAKKQSRKEGKNRMEQ